MLKYIDQRSNLTEKNYLWCFRQVGKFQKYTQNKGYVSFGQEFEFFETQVLTQNDFQKFPHALVSLNKFKLKRAQTI